MEDEEGYMALQRLSSKAERTQDMPTSPSCYKISTCILMATCVFLGLAVIMLSVFVFQGSFHKEVRAVCSNASEEGGEHLKSLPGSHPCSDMARLKSSLCGTPRGTSQCELCPVNWVLQKGKCYWFSKETKVWFEAYDYCTRKGAQMLVVQDSEEKEFIQNIIKGKYRFWIGLTSPSKSWTWVDGSILDSTLFSAPPPPTGNRCGVLKVNEIISEMCNDQFKWICQKGAILI